MKQIKIIIVDDHPLVRDGLATMLGTEADMSVIGTADDGGKAVSLCRKVGTPDVAIVDIRMRVMDGFQTLVALKRYAPSMRVLLLAGMPLKDELERARELGASGYLSKSSPTGEILTAIRNAYSGGPFQGDTATELRQNDILTRRETQVLIAIKDGLTRDQVADRLGISVETVRSHAKSIMIKLGVPSSAAAVGKGYELGLIK